MSHPAHKRARHVDRMPLAVGRVRNRETTLVDLRDDDGPVAEIMAAATEVEMAYADFHTQASREAMERWLDARVELRKVASRVAHGHKGGAPAAKRDTPMPTGVDASKVAETEDEGNEGGSP